MKKRVNLPSVSAGAILILSLLFAGGCTILAPEEPVDTGYYDLEQPQRIPTRVPVDVAPFSSLANERFRMSFRENAVCFRSSDRNRWTQTPGMLLTRYLRLAFRDDEKDLPAASDSKVLLSGEVLSFNTTGTHAVLAVRYVLQYKKHSVSKTILLKEKMAKFTPADFASAMSRACSRLGHLAAKESSLLVKKGTL